MLPKPQFTLKPIPNLSHVPNAPKFQRKFQRPPPIRQQQQGYGQIRCNMKGCRFMGDQESLDLHKKIQHFEFQHKCGSANSLMNSNNPEDIEKWRAQRRARYPKLANIQNTEKSELSTIECTQGQQNAFRRELQRSSSSNRHNNNYNRQHNNHRNNHNHNNYKRNHQYQARNNEYSSDFKRPKIEHNTDPVAVRPIVKSEVLLKPVNNSVPKPLNSFQLLSNYDSDSDEAPLEETTKKLSSEEIKRMPYEEPKPVENVDRIVKECMNSMLNKVQSQLKQQKVPQKRHPQQPKLYYDKLTMFQKLMLNDVRQNKSNLIECLKMLTADMKSFL